MPRWKVRKQDLNLYATRAATNQGSDAAYRLSSEDNSLRSTGTCARELISTYRTGGVSLRIRAV